MEDKEYKWAPWQRYVFILNIDGKDIFLGRHRRREGLCRRLNELDRYRGYKARIIDTKKGVKIENIAHGRYPCARREYRRS